MTKKISLVQQRYTAKIESKTLPINDSSNRHLCFRDMGSYCRIRERLLVFEIQCLRSILAVSRLNRIRNEDIRRSNVLAIAIVEVIKDKRIQQLEHMCRKSTDSWEYQAYKEDFSHSRPRRRSPRKWMVLFKEDTGLPNLTAEKNTQDRSRWRQSGRMCTKGRHDGSS